MTHPTPMPAPTRECAAFEPLLPLLATDALTPDEATAAREHVAGCAWCQVQRDRYDAFEAALRRHYGSDTALSAREDHRPLTLAGLMRADANEAENVEAMDDESSQLVLEVSSIAPAASRTFPTLRRPRWFTEIAAVVVVGLLAATLLLTRLGPLGGVLFSQQPLKTSAGAVVFTHSVSWGKLQINGRTVEATTDGRHPLYLPRGQNTLTYRAPPFPALTCTISAPAAPGDTCTLYIDHESDSRVPAFSGRIVDLDAVPDRISTTQRAALLTAVQRQLDTLDATLTILPGDHYSTPEGWILTANRTFTMTLKIHVAADGLGPVSSGCLPYCMGVPVDAWTISLTFSWDYVDQHGKPETVLQKSGKYSNPADTQIGIEPQWDGAWGISMHSEQIWPSLCSVATDMLTSRALNAGYHGGLSFGCGEYSHNPYEGTLFDLSMPGTGGSQPTGRVLYRGGAVIAVDSIAHDLAPWMPVASAHEHAIVSQLLGLSS